MAFLLSHGEAAVRLILKWWCGQGDWGYLTLDLRQINVLRQHRLTSLLLPSVPAAFLHHVHRPATHVLERKDLVGWHGVHMLTTFSGCLTGCFMIYTAWEDGSLVLYFEFTPHEVKPCVMKHAVQHIWP